MEHSAAHSLQAAEGWLGESRPRLRDAADVPVLEAARGGVAEKLESLIHRLYPFVVSFLVANILVVPLTVAFIGLGLLLTNVLIGIGPIGHWEEAIPVWLEGHRTVFLDDASFVASMIGHDVLVLVASVVILSLAFRQRWRIAGFLLAALLIELTAYRGIAEIVGRTRPDVVRLDVLQPDHSFPSGHTAASIALYGGLALLLTSRFRGIWTRTAIWGTTTAVVLTVALSRLYRGDHHPLDLVGGVLLGVGALLIALLATRMAVVADERRRSRPTRHRGEQ
jgi:membrane-associated phospholipid phosphatase